MKETDQRNYSLVKFPEKEIAYALLQTEAHNPFSVAIVGFTEPEPNYLIHRSAGHRFNVLEYVVEGEGELFLNGAWRTVKAGHAYLLRAGEEHLYRSVKSNPWKKMWINYVADYFPSLLNAYRLQTGIYTCPEVQNYFELALETVKREKNDAATGNRLAECVHKIVSLYAASLDAVRMPEEYRICEALNAALYQKADLNRLSEDLHLSKSSLIRIFKRCYGITPYEYLLNAKIDAAKALLLTTRISVKVLSERFGFEDEHYFSTLFYRRVGMRPGEFRKMNGNCVPDSTIEGSKHD